MQSVDKTTEEGKMQGVGCGGGLGADAPMSLERKCLVLVAAACIMVIIVGAVGIGFAIHPVAGLFALMLCAAWIGSAIAEVLKKSRDESSPNAEDQPTPGGAAATQKECTNGN